MSVPAASERFLPLYGWSCSAFQHSVTAAACPFFGCRVKVVCAEYCQSPASLFEVAVTWAYAFESCSQKVTYQGGTYFTRVARYASDSVSLAVPKKHCSVGKCVNWSMVIKRTKESATSGMLTHRTKFVHNFECLQNLHMHLLNTGNAPPDMLYDLMCKVPDLLDCLSAASLRHILATSPCLRQLVHQHVTKVSGLRCQQDMAVLVRAHWPRLVHICCGSGSPASQLDPDLTHELAQATQLHNQLQCLEFSSSQVSSGVVAVLLTASFTQLSSLQLSACSLDTACAESLSQSRLPSLQALDLSKNRLDASAMAYLCKANWPSLRKLRLAENPLKDNGIRHLVTARWPLLEKLDLECTSLEVYAIVYLCQAKWPGLQRLSLSSNRLWRDLPEIHTKAAWTALKEICLAACGLRWHGLGNLTLILHDLEVVDLLGNYMDAAMVQLLVQADWPKLVALRLDGHALDEAGMQEFIKGDWPRLERLYLSGIWLSFEVVTLLSQGNWPKLCKLDICSGTTAAYMRYPRGYRLACLEDIRPLFQADWPVLESLCLYNVVGDTLGVEELCRSCWPLLKTVHLSETNHDLAC